MLPFVPLGTVGEGQAAQVGGKAANLGQLLIKGFPVPPGIVVLVVAYEEHLYHEGRRNRVQDVLSSLDFTDEGAVGSASARIKDMILEGPMDDGQGIDDALQAIDPHALWSVRSSAVAEDLATASFAGQQDTYLNVRREEVKDHVRRCWASLWNARAMSYRHRAGVEQLGSGIAVVVQRMVDARSSGIMFTSDPVSGRRDRIVIESSWGLGESIASGLVTPDRFICDKLTSRLLERNVNRKVTGMFLSPHGSRSTPIPEEEQMSPSLSTEEVHQVCRMGRRIESSFGSPQDVEWALEGGELFILQSRPVTNLTPDGDTLWTRAYGDEYWSDVTSPLFFSLLGEMLTKYVNQEGSAIMGYRQLTDKELLRVHKGHVYFNASVLEEVFTYNPKFSRTNELLNYFPHQDQDRIARADTRLLARLWAEVRIAVLDNEGVILRTDKAYRKWAATFMRAAARFDALDLTSLDDVELRSEHEVLRKASLKHFRLIRYGMVTHSIGTNLMLKRWLQDWLDDRSGTLYSHLISGLEDNKTLRTNIALARLAHTALQDDIVVQKMASMTSREFVEALPGDARMQAFRQELGSFLEEYGHRSHTREMYFPRWADDPSLVIDVVRTLMSSDMADLEELERERIRERKVTEELVMRKLSRLRYGRSRRLAFRLVLRFAQTYLMFRENQRFYLDHLIRRWRVLFLEHGRRLAARGVLQSEDDVFFLTKEEVFELFDKGGDVRSTVAARRAEFERYQHVLPPKFLRGNVEFDDTVVRGRDTVRVTGVSASPGVVTAEVRVVATIADLPTLQRGEIMVTSNTDPGWTAVFSKLGGLITETGGILSHGAVVSREYGIPAVTAVKDATTFFRTGQRVTLDGNDGTIYIIGEE